MLDTTAGTASSEVHSSESAGAHGSSLSQDPHTIERRAAGGAAPEGLAGGWVEAVVILEGEAAEFFPILEPGGTYLFRGWTVLERSMGTAAMGTGAPVQLQMKGNTSLPPVLGRIAKGSLSDHGRRPARSRSHALSGSCTLVSIALG